MSEEVAEYKVDDGAETPKAWHETTDWTNEEGYEPSDRVKQFKSIPELARSWENAQEVILRKGITIPSDKATDEQKAEFRKTLLSHLDLKVPESADGYSWKPPEDVSDYFSDVSEQMAKYHEAGLDDKTVSMIMDDQMAQIKAFSEGLQEAQKDMAEKTRAELSEKWGDAYDSRMKNVNRFMQNHAEAVEQLSAMGLANSKAVIELIDDAARSTIEGRPQGESSQTDAATELDNIKKSDAYRNVRHPDHHDSIKRMIELRKQMLG